MNIGYAFYGFLSDYKISNGHLMSTPDGNAFYSWSIINALLREDHTVFMLMPDRDYEAVKLMGENAFNAFAKEDRYKSYTGMVKPVKYSTEYANNPLSLDSSMLPNLDLVLLEWRFPIPGRNCSIDKSYSSYQPDLDIQGTILEKYKGNTPIIALDLDYKMNDNDDRAVDWTFELGFKRGASHHIEIPFDFAHINDFPILESNNNIVYVGNRYERDWAIDAYLSADLNCDIDVYGNWESKGSNLIWPHINFHDRIHPAQIRDAYKNAAVVPLLLKKEYCDNGFMTARIIESVFYGSVPLITQEFKSPVAYLSEDFIVGSLAEIRHHVKRASIYKNRIRDIRFFRRNLASIMDVDMFVKSLMSAMYKL